jgi:hypothetical protein
MDIYITEIKVEGNTIQCYSETDVADVKPAELMIVDSDNMALIYLADRPGEDEYDRVQFVPETWSYLKENYGKEIMVNDALELASFFDELDFLLDNIKDNNNYGKAFEERVTAEFEL